MTLSLLLRGIIIRLLFLISRDSLRRKPDGPQRSIILRLFEDQKDLRGR